MLRRLIGIMLAVTLFSVFCYGQALAATMGIADGTYDFGDLGADNSAGQGYAKLGDKFKVGNNKFEAWKSLNSGPYTAIYPNDTTTLSYTAVINAEGGSTCKTFTFNDLGISATADLQKFEALDIVLRDINEVQIGSTISLGSSPVYSTTSVTNISALYSQAPWGVDGVATIEITYTLSANSSPVNAWFLNLENITIANVSAPSSAPVIFGIAPSIGPTAGGTAVVITGADFTGITAVNFGSNPAASYTVNSPTQITAISPPGSAGMVDITVTSGLGASANGIVDQFNYTNIPTVTKISPPIGSAVGGTTVTITGFNFTGATAVKFGSADAGFTLDSDTQITVTSPPVSAGTVNVTVTTPSGTSAVGAVNQFNYVASTTVFSISPSSGPTGGGTSVIITGVNFSGVTAVKFGTVDAGFTLDSDTQITAITPATIPAGSTITADVTVTTPLGGTSATGPADLFTFNNATGTADGTYDFGSLGDADSAGQGYAKLGDKFKVGNNQYTQYPSVNSGPETAIYPDSSTKSLYSSVINAEGGSTCKTFTFRDLGISAYNELQKFASLDIVLKDINGTQIGSTISLGTSPVYSTSVITKISGLYGKSEWSVDDVAAIEITYAIDKNGSPSLASDLNLENITIANIHVAPGAPTGVSATVGNGQATVTFSAPASTGGAAITGYSVTSSPAGGIDTNAGTTGLSHTITGLTNGTAYTFTVTATSSAGTGVASSASNGVTPVASQTITFINPGVKNLGTNPILAATASSGLTPLFTSSTVTVCTITSGGVLTILKTGTCTINADQSGNAAFTAAPQVTQSFAIEYGITPPQIIISTLDDNSVSSIATINVAGKLTAQNGLQKLTINGLPLAVDNSGSFSSPVTLLPGKNSITVIATDNNNLTGTVTRTITLDASAPLIMLPSGQTDNSVTSSSRITVSGGVDADTTTVKISVNGGNPVSATMSGTGFSLTVDLSGGLNTIIITATDTSGKSSSIKQSIVLDASLSLAITAPARDLKSGKADFILTGMVNGAAPLTVTLVMDGQSFTPTVTNGGFSQALTFAAEKNYPIVVTAADGNGNSVSVTRNVNYAWLGDADGSGTTDLIDILNAYQISKGVKSPTATDMTRCDVAPLDANGKPAGNGIIDIGDVILLLRNRVGLINW